MCIRDRRHVDRSVRGDQDHGQLRVTPADFAKQVETITVGKAYIEQQQIEGMLFEFGKPRSSGSRAGDTVAFAGEQQLKAFADFGFVVDYKDGTLRPVSYTHLDVYKRQDKRWVVMFCLSSTSQIWFFRS